MSYSFKFFVVVCNGRTFNSVVYLVYTAVACVGESHKSAKFKGGEVEGAPNPLLPVAVAGALPPEEEEVEDL